MNAVVTGHVVPGRLVQGRRRYLSMCVALALGGLSLITAPMGFAATRNGPATMPVASTSVAAASVAPETAVQRYIRHVYADLFNRAPDPTGLATWTTALTSGTPRVAVANAITSSTEYRTGLITGSYQHYLGRGPDPAGLGFWLGKMSSGWTVSQIESGFIASDEYYAKAGSTGDGWVTKLYADVLGRTAGPSEVAFWMGQLASGASRSQVAMGFLLSTERLDIVVTGYYQHLLGRGLDPVGQSTWVGILQAGGRNEAIVGGIIASEEYWGKTAVLDHLVLAPASATITAGGSQTYTAQGFDAANYSLGDVTAATIFTVDTTVACPAATCSPTTAGDHTVTGTDGTATGTATLHVNVIATPGPVTGVSAIPSTSIALSWTNPADASFTGVMIRRALGATPPASASAGTLVTDVAKPATSFTDPGLASGTQYSYALFAHDAAMVFAAAATVTSTTTAAAPGAVSGTVTEAGGTNHGLANVWVTIGSEGTNTADDGTYTVRGLAAGTDYTVCFNGSTDVTGGSSDAFGYVGQCYDNKPLSGTPTSVTVTGGATRTGIDAALATGGAIHGTVTAAEGSGQGLAQIWVYVSSLSNGAFGGLASTTDDGSYTVTGLPAGTDYQVRFDGYPPMGGGSGPPWYLGQYYKDQLQGGTPTAVSVTVGATTDGIDAALATGGAIQGTVTAAEGINPGNVDVNINVHSPSTGYTWGRGVALGHAFGMNVPAGTDYQVCFSAPGYVDQCYNNQSMGTPTPVSVTVGAVISGIDAALVETGAP